MEEVQAQFWPCSGLFWPCLALDLTLDQPRSDLDQPRSDLDQPRSDLDQPGFDLDQPGSDLVLTWISLELTWISPDLTWISPDLTLLTSFGHFPGRLRSGYSPADLKSSIMVSSETVRQCSKLDSWYIIVISSIESGLIFQTVSILPETVIFSSNPLVPGRCHSGGPTRHFEQTVSLLTTLFPEDSMQLHSI